ncbi:MAG: hypothetical protein AAGD22_03065 [Verrucomicrobiota bacterium]
MMSLKHFFYSVYVAGVLCVPGMLTAGPSGKSPICEEAGRSVTNSIYGLMGQPDANPNSKAFKDALAQILVSHLGAQCDCIEEIAWAAYSAVDPDNSALLTSTGANLDNLVTDTILGHCGQGYAGLLAQIFSEVRGEDEYGPGAGKSAVSIIAPAAATAIPFSGDIDGGVDPVADDRVIIVITTTTPPPISPTNTGG